MWPVLLRLPFLNVALTGQGFFMVAGLVACLALAAWLASRDGVDPERVVTLGLLLAVAALLGARAAWPLSFPGTAGLGDFVRWRAWPGAVLYGGLIAGLVASVPLARLMGLPWRRVADAAAPGVAIGIALGRVGCFAAGCCYGAPCDHAWGVRYPVETLEWSGAPLWTPLHPAQLYEAALAAAICAALVALHRRRAYPGQVILWLFALYPAARFAVECFRGDDRGELLGLAAATGLSPAQLISLALSLAAAALLAGRGLAAAPARPDSASWAR